MEMERREEELELEMERRYEDGEKRRWRGQEMEMDIFLIRCLSRSLSWEKYEHMSENISVCIAYTEKFARAHNSLCKS